MGLPDGAEVYLHFEEHATANEFRVGSDWFEPVPASAVTLAVEAVQRTHGCRIVRVGD